MDENGRARSPADLMANGRAAWGADALVPQAGIRADDIRRAAFPTGSPQRLAGSYQWRWPALRTTHREYLGRHPERIVDSRSLTVAGAAQVGLLRSHPAGPMCIDAGWRAAPGSLFPVELQPLEGGCEHLERARV